MSTTVHGARWRRRYSTRFAGIFFKQTAGLEPGVLNPLVIKVLREIDIDISANKTQSVFDVFKSAKLFPFVITVCSESEAKACPIFPGVTTQLHWPFDDPAKVTGAWEEKLEGTRRIRDEICDRIEAWCDEMFAIREPS